MHFVTSIQSRRPSSVGYRVLVRSSDAKVKTSPGENKDKRIQNSLTFLPGAFSPPTVLVMTPAAPLMLVCWYHSHPSHAPSLLSLSFLAISNMEFYNIIIGEKIRGSPGSSCGSANCPMVIWGSATRVAHTNLIKGKIVKVHIARTWVPKDPGPQNSRQKGGAYNAEAWKKKGRASAQYLRWSLVKMLSRPWR